MTSSSCPGRVTFVGEAQRRRGVTLLGDGDAAVESRSSMKANAAIEITLVGEGGAALEIALGGKRTPESR